MNNQFQLKGSAFMVMPFSDDIAEKAYLYSTKPIVESFGLKVLRADQIFSTNPIFDDIISALEQAAFVIVDISGQNPNCFYELGIAHTLKRSHTIIVTHDEYKNNPFDIAHFRIIQYKDSFTGKEEYESKLKSTINAITSGISNLFADEFKYLLKLLKSTKTEHAIWGLQAISISKRSLLPKENTKVEGVFPQSKEFVGMSQSGPLLDFLRPFYDIGYVIIVGDKLILTEKGRAFVDYVTSTGYQVYRINEQKFVENYISAEERLKQQNNSSAP
jgi:hypothetical protein